MLVNGPGSVPLGPSAHHLDVDRQRYLFLFDQEKLILANVRSAELIRRFAEET
jgi:hypothetical protein